MKHFATIDLHVTDDGYVVVEAREPRGVGAFQLGGIFATCDAALQAIAGFVARLRPRRLIAGAAPAGDRP